MTLTTRLSLFFLTLLGIVLVGFSATLYLLTPALFFEIARSYSLQRQASCRWEKGASLDCSYR